MNKIGGATESFGGLANPAIISYLATLNTSVANSNDDLSKIKDEIDHISILLEKARQDISLAEIDIDDLQNRMDIEEGISIDLLSRMVIEEGLSADLQESVNELELLTATHESEITTLQDEMAGQQSSMDLAYKRMRLIEYPIVNSITGSVPLLVGQFILPPGDYFSANVNIGCSLPADTAILSIVAGASELVSIASTGPPTWIIADDFTLTEDTEIKLWLSADTMAATAMIYCIKFEVY